MSDEKSDDRRVKGRVHTYSRAVNAGVIIIGNKKMYLFWRKDWLSAEEPKINMNVVFIPQRKWARSIMVEEDGAARA